MKHTYTTANMEAYNQAQASPHTALHLHFAGTAMWHFGRLSVLQINYLPIVLDIRRLIESKRVCKNIRKDEILTIKR